MRGLFAWETCADEQRGEIDLARCTGLGENRLELAAHGVARHAEAAGSARIGEVHPGQHLRAGSRFASPEHVHHTMIGDSASPKWGMIAVEKRANFKRGIGPQAKANLKLCLR